MAENDKAILVYSTFPSLAAAEEVGGALVEAGLVACANIIPGMVSIYVWQGERARDQEVAMLLKTTPALAERVVEEVRRRHPYETPAVLVIPVAGGSQPFLDWIARQTSAAG